MNKDIPTTTVYGQSNKDTLLVRREKGLGFVISRAKFRFNTHSVVRPVLVFIGSIPFATH